MPLGPRRVSRPIRRGGRRRSTTWATVDQNVNIAAGASSNIDIWAGLGVAGSNTVGLTVMRTLLLIHVRNFQLPADILRAGLILDDKDLVGTTRSIAADFNKDWYWWSTLQSVCSGSAAVNAAVYFPGPGATPYDIRARRVSKDMGRTSMLAFVNGSATSLNIDVLVRQLVALP
jgi:hypothetical protein